MPLVLGALAYKQAAVSLNDGGEDANGHGLPTYRLVAAKEK
jgi:hypothetical protein